MNLHILGGRKSIHIGHHCFWYRFLFAVPRISCVEQKDWSFGSSCRFLLSWLVLDRALVTKNKKAGGVVVFVCPAVSWCNNDATGSF